jgi:hypothetical protein
MRGAPGAAWRRSSAARPVSNATLDGLPCNGALQHGHRIAEAQCCVIATLSKDLVWTGHVLWRVFDPTAWFVALVGVV